MNVRAYGPGGVLRRAGTLDVVSNGRKVWAAVLDPDSPERAALEARLTLFERAPGPWRRLGTWRAAAAR